MPVLRRGETADGVPLERTEPASRIVCRMRTVPAVVPEAPRPGVSPRQTRFGTSVHLPGVRNHRRAIHRGSRAPAWAMPGVPRDGHQASGRPRPRYRPLPGAAVSVVQLDAGVWPGSGSYVSAGGGVFSPAPMAATSHMAPRGKSRRSSYSRRLARRFRCSCPRFVGSKFLGAVLFLSAAMFDFLVYPSGFIRA